MNSLHVETKKPSILIVGASTFYTTMEHLVDEQEKVLKIYSDTFEGVANITHALIHSCEELFSAIKDFKPTILHFTGHGGPGINIELENSTGELNGLSGASLAKLLRKHKIHLECIFFSNCSLTRNSKTLLNFVDYIAGAKIKTGSFDVSRLITTTFYTALCEKLNYRSAYNYLINILVEENHYSIKDIYRDKSDLIEKESRGMRPSIAHDTTPTNFTIDEMASSSKSLPRERQKLSSPTTSKAQPTEDKRLYRVWFGTNRKPVDKDSISKGFGSDRNKGITYGCCDVTIPKYHTIGSIGDPWWKRLPAFWKDNNLRIQDRVSIKIETYYENLREYFEKLDSDEKHLLIFLHGYNVSFDDAAIRSAQLGFDLDVHGTTAFFSWPSQGTIAGYPADIASIEASEKYIGKYIEDMASKSGAEKVHIIAHSMGNRGLLRAYSNMFNNVQKIINKPFDQIFLAAPDVDVDLFKDLSKVYSEVSNKTTMYVSREDMALMSSGIIHKAPRVGYTPPVTVVEGIDTIEVTDIDLTFLGHGYVADARPVLSDMHNLMMTGKGPDLRFALKRIESAADGVYWRMKE